MASTGRLSTRSRLLPDCCEEASVFFCRSSSFSDTIKKIIKNTAAWYPLTVSTLYEQHTNCWVHFTTYTPTWVFGQVSLVAISPQETLWLMTSIYNSFQTKQDIISPSRSVIFHWCRVTDLGGTNFHHPPPWLWNLTRPIWIPRNSEPPPTSRPIPHCHPVVFSEMVCMVP